MSIYHRDFGSMGDMITVGYLGPIYLLYMGLCGIPLLWKTTGDYDGKPIEHDELWLYCVVSSIIRVLVVPLIAWLCYKYQLMDGSWFVATWFFCGLVAVLDWVILMVVHDGNWR